MLARLIGFTAAWTAEVLSRIVNRVDGRDLAADLEHAAYRESVWERRILDAAAERQEFERHSLEARAIASPRTRMCDGCLCLVPRSFRRCPVCRWDNGPDLRSAS